MTDIGADRSDTAALPRDAQRFIARDVLSRLPLHRRFALAGGLVTLIGMLLIGSWVNERIVESVTRNSAVTTALYMESFIMPLTQELSATDAVAPATAARLDALFREPHFAARIAMVKIWKPGGLIAYSTSPEIVGRTLKTSSQLRDAWAGLLSAEFDAKGGAEDLLERAAGLPLLEVYNPIHSTRTGEVIAVAEFYQIAGELKADLFAARMMSWAIVATICLTMFGLLFGIVLRGARTIERQRAELELRLAQVARMSEQNAALHRRIQGASLRGSELDERRLRRISAELHDGPAQALAHASLRLDSLFRRATGGGAERATETEPEVEPEVEVIRSSLGDAMREIREICRGLSLPHIEGKPLGDVIAMVTGAQARRSGADIAVDMPPAARSRRLTHSTAICIYRFVQEGLANAIRHGGTDAVQVICALDGDRLTVTVLDHGRGFDPTAERGAGLGLAGLRERVESIGGEFDLTSAPGNGARLTLTLQLGD